MAKQIFNIIVFTGNKLIGNDGFVKYRKVNDINKFVSFISNKYPLWKFATIYDNVTKDKIKVITP
jgi:hypothetical protein